MFIKSFKKALQFAKTESSKTGLIHQVSSTFKWVFDGVDDYIKVHGCYVKLLVEDGQLVPCNCNGVSTRRKTFKRSELGDKFKRCRVGDSNLNSDF